MRGKTSIDLWLRREWQMAAVFVAPGVRRRSSKILRKAGKTQIVWAFRGKLKAGTLVTSRAARHFEALAYLKVRYPGQSNNKTREKCAGMLLHNVPNQDTTIWNFTPEQRIEAITALQWWEHQLQQGQMHPTLIAKLEDEFCPGIACQYQDKITETRMQYWLCRSWECLWMGRAIDWAVSYTGGTWACIMCNKAPPRDCG